ncbi:GNAT family N-acetyltransferase [Shewanella donghaensis]|uniref:GNAT family N-acetyltransferase n=1 Tax=Shewanella donghaensis TaxID=238836 RepID=UPI0011846A1B|nr:GNAT family N-acetyltransferase [Shewanella donghaensis]
MKMTISPIIPKQDSQVASIIKCVGEEFGAVGEGFGPSDPEVEEMSQYYHIDDKSVYLVATIDNKIVGGAGIAKFNDDDEICELRKLFLLPESRGFGLGKGLTEQCLNFAKEMGFKQCYLDTLASMTSAISLYEKMGFSHLDKPLIGTIHGGCDVWMIKDL